MERLRGKDPPAVQPAQVYPRISAVRMRGGQLGAAAGDPPRCILSSATRREGGITMCLPEIRAAIRFLQDKHDTSYLAIGALYLYARFGSRIGPDRARYAGRSASSDSPAYSCLTRAPWLPG